MTELHVTMDAYAPAEMARHVESLGVVKANLDTATTFALAVLAGAFIALGANFATVVFTNNGLGYGVSRLLGGLAFSLGLILVIVGGAELFTGNNLLLMAWASGKVTTTRLLRNWAIAYVGNFVGALSTAVGVYLSRQWTFGEYHIGATALTIANAKVNYGFVAAFSLGVFCNGLVCLAVWLCFSARTTTDKILAIMLPITAFVAGGFEHSIANIYFIPMGMLVRGDLRVLEVAGKSAEQVANLTWTGFLWDNLLPVTLGNMFGGVVMVGAAYWFVYLRGMPGNRVVGTWQRLRGVQIPAQQDGQPPDPNPRGLPP
ncbi:MAG: formate/nitrite transporter family protein, partial [Nitrospinae bacterium]|nr:formate/nitrite transporter family protein [Nitrospinota bacterium]